MLALKHLFLSVGLLFIALIVIACGNAGSGSTSSTSNGSGGTATSVPSSPAPVIKTATATVNGKSETVLVNVGGQTLYYFKSDTATTAACTGSCVGVWPPLILQGSGAPTSAVPLSGKLSVVTNANGRQVEYNGHPLYTYSKDATPGQVNGEGFNGKWFVATPDLSSQS